MIKKKIPMPSFKTLSINFNTRQIEFFDVIPYLLEQFNNKFKTKKDLKLLKQWSDFVDYIREESMYKWWSKAEYECLITDINKKNLTKIDIYQQVLANLELICYLLYNYLKQNINLTFCAINKNCFNVLHIDPKIYSPVQINILPVIDNLTGKKLKEAIIKELREKYSEGIENKLIVQSWPFDKAEQSHELTVFDLLFENIDVLCSVANFYIKHLDYRY